MESVTIVMKTTAKNKANLCTSLLWALLIACSSNHAENLTPVEENDSIASSDSCRIVKRHYANGALKDQGQLCSGERNGHWMEFYADGRLKWEGDYKMGYRKLVETDSTSTVCEFNFDDTLGFAVNKPRQCRIIVPPFNPKDLIVYINHGSIDSAHAGDLYDHTFTPGALTDFCIEVLYRHRPNYRICKRCYPVNAR